MNTHSLPGIDALPPATVADAIAAIERISEVDEELAALIASSTPEPARVLGCSQFIANWCVRYPDVVRTLIEDGELGLELDASMIEQRTVTALAGATDEASLMTALRLLRQREWLRVGWRDLAGVATLDEVLGTLSHFADACVDHSLACLCKLLEIDSAGFYVIGMGKLGGRELNFSSDIDVIYGIETDDEPSRAQLRLAQTLTRVLEQSTAEGFAFRVDTRLRPHGGAGPILFSSQAMEHYYQTHGRDWERYAWIKARVIAGDIDAGQRLCTNLKPFVYRKYLDYGAFEAIREMQSMINRELSRRGIANDIKRGRGGIRQIEFIAQSQQLLRGGRMPELMTNSLAEALRALVELGHMTRQCSDSLSEAYDFLRRTEHRLQIHQDQQGHTLPDQTDDSARLAASMGLTHDDFNTRLEQIRQSVDAEFRDSLGVDNARDSDVSAWRSDPAEALDVADFEQAGFDDAEEAERLCRLFRDGSLMQSLSTEGRSRIDTLMPRLLDACAATAQPARALAACIRLLEAIGRRPTYFSALIEYPQALTQVVALCHASPWMTSILGSHPSLLEELVSPSESSDFDSNALEQELSRLLSSDDEEQVMVEMRELKHSWTFRSAAQLIHGDRNGAAICQQLSTLADSVIEAVRHHAISLLADRLPASVTAEPRFAVIAYGKLGSRELGFGSDLDIIFLYDDDGSYSDELSSAYVRIGQRMISLFTTRLANGDLYEVDVRLRPSGNKGLLVSSIDAWRNYQEKDAWTFEHQALVRARAIAGDEAAQQKFEQIRESILCRERDVNQLAQDVTEMRDRMITANDSSTADSLDLKLGRGAMVDIEFLVQFGVLANARQHPELTSSTSTVELIEILERCGFFSKTEAEHLSHAFNFYLERLNARRLNNEAALDPVDEVEDVRDGVRQVWTRLLEQQD